MRPLYRLVSCGTLSVLSILALSGASFGQSEPKTSFGEKPELPAPEKSWVPTIKWASTAPWPEGATPKAADGLSVKAFAKELKHPRWLYVLPNGDVLVAESSTEASPSWSPKSLAQTWVQRQAGAIVENANRISILRDTNGDGVADEQSVFLEGLRQPFGMALIGDQLYVANTDSVVRFPYKRGDKKITDKGTKLVDIPVGHHWTRNLLPNADGTKLFVTVGSGSNIGENGLESEKERATIWELDLASNRHRIFASGLRNANGMAIEPSTGNLWTVVNERDEIGDNVPPDYLTSVQDGGFYGWPYSYWGKNVDERVQPQKPDLVEKALTPDYALGAHTASLGLAYSDQNALPETFRNGMIIGQHGSWNRSELSGYKVVFVPFKNGRPAGAPNDILTGFIDNGVAHGRPVGVAFDHSGALLVADDAGNTIWRVVGSTGATQPTSRAPDSGSTGRGPSQ